MPKVPSIGKVIKTPKRTVNRTDAAVVASVCRQGESAGWVAGGKIQFFPEDIKLMETMTKSKRERFIGKLIDQSRFTKMSGYNKN